MVNQDYYLLWETPKSVILCHSSQTRVPSQMTILVISGTLELALALAQSMAAQKQKVFQCELSNCQLFNHQLSGSGPLNSS